MVASKPKYVHCFICGSIRENENTKVGRFSVPENKLQEWKVIIGNDELKPTSKLCSYHFSNDDIIKGKIIGGTFFPFEKYWRLNKDAVPKFLLDKPSLLPKTIQEVNGLSKRPVQKSHASNNVLKKQEEHVPIVISVVMTSKQSVIDLDSENSTFRGSITSSVQQQDFPTTNVTSQKKKLKKNNNKSNKHPLLLLPSRMSYSNGHKFVPFTSRKLGKISRLSCRNWYPLIRKLETTEEKYILKVRAEKNRNRKLREHLNTTRQKLNRSYETIASLKKEIVLCHEKILELKELTIAEKKK